MTEDTELGNNLDMPAPAARKKVAKDAKADTHTWIVLEENDDIPPTGQFIGHNGTGFLLRPGEPAQVPNYIVEILDNAIISMPQLDPATKQVVGSRERMRFGYRRVNAPQVAEQA